MKAAEQMLVLGGDSLIGSGLVQHWRKAGNVVKATSRRASPGDADYCHLDLAEDLSIWNPPFRGGVAVICAANANQEQCRRDPICTRRINVEQTLAVARRLAAADYFVVFLSTSVVFDGLKPFAATTDPVHPMTEYGRQKAEAEAGILQLSDRAAVVRLGKVVHRDLAIFRSWRAAMAEGQTITPFSDYICSPVALAQTVECLSRIAETQSHGIWHLAAKDEISYAEIARIIARKDGFPENLIQPTTAPKGLLEYLPKHASLDISRTEHELQISPPDSRHCINDLM